MCCWMLDSNKIWLLWMHININPLGLKTSPKSQNQFTFSTNSFKNAIAQKSFNPSWHKIGGFPRKMQFRSSSTAKVLPLAFYWYWLFFLSRRENNHSMANNKLVEIGATCNWNRFVWIVRVCAHTHKIWLWVVSI